LSYQRPGIRALRPSFQRFFKPQIGLDAYCFNRTCTAVFCLIFPVFPYTSKSTAALEPLTSIFPRARPLTFQ